jgi:prevent-host-death family protein
VASNEEGDHRTRLTRGLRFLARMAKSWSPRESQMRKVSAKDAKYNFGKLIDLARAAPIAVTKYDRPVAVVMAVEEYDRLAGRSAESASRPNPARQAKRPRKRAGP